MRPETVAAWPLLVDAIANAAQGAVFVAIGMRLVARTVWRGDRLAIQVFGAWWFLFGIQALFAGARGAIVAGGFHDVELYMLLFYVGVILSFLALAGALLYLDYLRRGRYASVPVGFGVAAVIGFAYVVALQWHGPAEVVVEGLRTDVHFDRTLEPMTRWLLLGGFYVPLALTGGFFAYLARITQDEHRVRSAAVAAVIFCVATSDVLVLGPSEGGPWLTVASALRIAAAGIAGAAFLRQAPREAST